MQYAIDVRNCVFPRFGLPKVKDIDAYHEQFTFPVKVYYERAGVTEENFQAVANAWMDEYVSNCQSAPLFADAVDAINAFAANGYAQIVLSASKRENLLRQLAIACIADRFDGVLGLSHIYATDKTEIAREYMAEHRIDPKTCVLLGDTVHDARVADALAMDCVLIARGHMSRARLAQTGYPVCADLREAVRLVLRKQ